MNNEQVVNKVNLTDVSSVCHWFTLDCGLKVLYILSYTTGRNEVTQKHITWES